MRETTSDITKLCESCWEHLADASKLEQRSYAEELLHLLGWEQPLPFTPKEGAQSLSAAPYLLRAGGQTTVAVYFVLPGTLEPPSAARERGLDYCSATRLLADEARTLNVNYMLVTDLYRAYLYDVRTDELLLGADSPAGFNEDFAPALRRSEMERGALEELRREPRSVVARRLREWNQRWIETFSVRGRISEELASVLIDRLLVIRYLFDHDILRRTKWRLQQRFQQITQSATTASEAGCGVALVKLFHDMWFDWRIDLFEPLPELDRVLERDALAEPLLREFNLLSDAKFSVATVLESFNYGEPAEKMRVRMVPDVNEEREQYLSKQTLETIDEARIEIDLLEEGYRAIFHWFDRVVALYERLEVDFDSKSYQQQPAKADMDLFAWSEIDSTRPSACADKLAHACDCGFGVYYSSAHQYRVARLMLTLHLIGKYDQIKQTVNCFPSFVNVLMKRPKVLSPDRIMHVHPAVNEYEEVERLR